MSRAHLFPRGELSVVGTNLLSGTEAVSSKPRHQSKRHVQPLLEILDQNAVASPQPVCHEYENNLKKQIYFLELEVKYLKEKMGDQGQDTVVVHVQTSQDKHVPNESTQGTSVQQYSTHEASPAFSPSHPATVASGSHDAAIGVHGAFIHSSRVGQESQMQPTTPRQPSSRGQHYDGHNILNEPSLDVPSGQTSPTPRDLQMRPHSQHIPQPISISGVTPRPPQPTPRDRFSTLESTQRVMTTDCQTSARNPSYTHANMQTTPRNPTGTFIPLQGSPNDVDLEHLVALDVTIRALKDEFLKREQEYQIMIDDMHLSHQTELKEREEELQRCHDDTKRDMLEQIDELVSTSQQERERLTCEIVTLQRKLECDLRQTDSAQNELDAAVRANEERKAENLHLKDSVKSMELQLEVSKLQQRKLESDLQAARHELYSSKSMVQEFHLKFGNGEPQDISSLRQESKELEGEVRRQEILIQKLQREKMQDAEYKTRLEEDARKHLEAQVEHQQTEAKLEKTRSQWMTKCESLELIIKEGDTSRDALRIEVDSLKSELDRLHVEQKQTAGQLKTERKIALELEEQLQAAKSKIDQQASAMADAQNNFAVIDTTNGELRTHNRLLTDEMAQLKQQLAQMKEKYNSLETEYNALKRQNADLQRQVVLAQGIRDLQMSQAQFEHLLTSNLKVAENIHNLMNAFPTTPDIAATSATLSHLVQPSSTAPHGDTKPQESQQSSQQQTSQ